MHFCEQEAAFIAWVVASLGTIATVLKFYGRRAHTWIQARFKGFGRKCEKTHRSKSQV